MYVYSEMNIKAINHRNEVLGRTVLFQHWKSLNVDMMNLGSITGHNWKSVWQWEWIFTKCWIRMLIRSCLMWGEALKMLHGQTSAESWTVTVKLWEAAEIHCINGEGKNCVSYSNPLRDSSTPLFCPWNVTYHWGKSAHLLSHFSSFSSSENLYEIAQVWYMWCDHTSQDT